MFSVRKLKCFSNLLGCRQIHGNSKLLENCTEIRNRNPRNLELIRIARKPAGWHLEKPGSMYWHKLVITRNKKFVKAEICHFKNGPVISVSSQEWALKKQLYRTYDTTAYRNIGRLLAQRCLECGIYEFSCNMDVLEGTKISILLDELTKNGISLVESERYVHPTSWDLHRYEKPWEVYE